MTPIDVVEARLAVASAWRTVQGEARKSLMIFECQALVKVCLSQSLRIKSELLSFIFTLAWFALTYSDNNS